MLHPKGGSCSPVWGHLVVLPWYKGYQGYHISSGMASLIGDGPGLSGWLLGQPPESYDISLAAAEGQQCLGFSDLGELVWE